MNLKIHRGTKEIGGSCVEIWTKSTRILVDFGMPLVEPDGSEFNFNKYKNLSIQDLVKRKVLPDLKGAFKSGVPTLDGILISHPHLDHYGFTNFLHEEIQFYIGEAAYRIINVSNQFIGKDPMFQTHKFYEHEKTFQIGDISITPFLMDHSAFDSYAFLIEADNNKIFYSGDFRGHGRKDRVFKWFTHNAPGDIDYLLLEGTMMGRNSLKNEKSEKKIQQEFEQIFSQGGINLVYTSGQNIDRLVSIYIACNKTNKIFVVDPYIASILKESAKFSDVQYPSQGFRNIKVFFPYFLTGRMLRNHHENLIYPYKKFKITRDEINQDPGKYVICIRPSMKVDLSKITGIEGGNLIYSIWEGYLSKEPTKSFVEYLTKRNITLHKVHTSGHADIPTLKSMVEAINPKYIIPIHTFAATEYGKVFTQPIKEISDGEILKI